MARLKIDFLAGDPSIPPQPFMRTRGTLAAVVEARYEETVTPGAGWHGADLVRVQRIEDEYAVIRVCPATRRRIEAAQEQAAQHRAGTPMVLIEHHWYPIRFEAGEAGGNMTYFVRQFGRDVDAREVRVRTVDAHQAAIAGATKLGLRWAGRRPVMAIQDRAPAPIFSVYGPWDQRSGGQHLIGTVRVTDAGA